MKDGPDPKLCFLYDGPTIIQQPLDHTNLTQKLVDGFVRFLDHQPASQPFFFYFSFPQVHTDLFSSPQFKGKSRRGTRTSSCPYLAFFPSPIKRDVQIEKLIFQISTKFKSIKLDKKIFNSRIRKS